MKPRIELDNANEVGERQAYRMIPLSADQLRFIIDKHSVNVRNLSVSGVAFTSDKPIKLGMHRASIEFKLEGKDHIIECRVEVIYHQKAGFYGGSLSDISQIDERLLSKLIVESQKQAILQKKQTKPSR